MSASTSTDSARLTAPTLRRRFLCMTYEALLLFAVLFIAGYLFSALLQQRHGLQYRLGLQAWLFFVLGIYFTGFWHRGGQTLAMKTWRIRLMSADGLPLRWGQLIARYLLAWLWFVPALIADAFLTLQGWPSLMMVLAGALLWGATVFFDRDRQFLHDRIAGTRLVNV